MSFPCQLCKEPRVTHRWACSGVVGTLRNMKQTQVSRGRKVDHGRASPLLSLCMQEEEVSVQNWCEGLFLDPMDR